MPERIQRKRTKGWRMPEGAVYVGRPSRWGNPFWLVADLVDLDRSLALYDKTAHGIWQPGLLADQPDWMFSHAYDSHTRWLMRIGGHPIEVARSDLAGRNLACWCPPSAPCHADVLLEVANR